MRILMLAFAMLANILGAAHNPNLTIVRKGAPIAPTCWAVMSGSSFYTPKTLETYQPSNVTISGSQVTIQTTISGSIVTSGGVSSRGLCSMLYGRIDATMTLPAGAGVWPAIWMMPADGSASYEIDVMESLGDPSTMYLTNHHAKSHDDSTIVKHLSAGPHTVTVLWEPGSLIWQVDGVTERTITAYVPDVPMFTYINTAVGGWAGPPTGDVSTQFSVNLSQGS